MSKTEDQTQVAEAEIAISVMNVSKTFHLPHEKHSGIKQLLINAFQGKHEKGYSAQRVLKDVSFEVQKGDFFGIVGRNGSGKSTLLKIIAGIYEPDSGEVMINGSLVPFIELGVGFNPELTGRENIFMNGALLGFNRQEMLSMYDDIVEFAELEGFMDQKLKNYSSGMQVRLAFSIAIRADTDILVLDEVLAVGDEAFQRKCYEYFARLKRDKKTVILVTHSMDSVLQFCNKAMLIDKGHDVQIGSPLQIAQIYRELNNDEDVTVNSSKDEEKDEIGTKYLEANMRYAVKNDNLVFDIHLKPKQDLEDPIVGFEIFRDDGEQVIRWVSDEKLDNPIQLKKGEQLDLSISLQNIFPIGIFSVRLLVRRRDRVVDYGIFNAITKFEIKNKSAYQYDIFWKPQEDVLLKSHHD